MNNDNLLLIGCGNIGGTLLSLWVGHGYFKTVTVVQPSLSHAKEHVDKPQVKFVERIDEVEPNFGPDITVLAIKPQDLPAIAPHLRKLKSKMVVSLLAGIGTDRFNSMLDADTAIILIMPNVALKYGKSMNLAYAKENLSTDNRTYVERMFAPTGKLIWLDTEGVYSSLGPISGSGPAYFFLLAQLLLEETVKLGVRPDIAATIVQQTMLGAASLIEHDINYAELIESVKSKRGITEAALQILQPNLAEILHKAIAAAIARSKELNNESSG